MKSGMKHMIESFYASIIDDAPVPIPYGEILLTSRIMDTIFDQLSEGNSTSQVPGGRGSGKVAPDGTLAHTVAPKGEAKDDFHNGY